MDQDKYCSKEDDMSITKKTLSHVIIGFRFEKAFRVGDIAGGICDTALHHKSTPFGTEFFPRYQDTGTLDRALLNDDRKHFLRITTSDIVFQYTLQSKNGDQEKELDWIRKDAVPFIVDKIIVGKNIKNILRVGMMMGHIIEGVNLGGSIITRLTDNTESKSDQFSLTFGRKDTAIESLIRKDVDDYVNRLFLMQQVSQETYDLTFDYQYYFNPPIHDLVDWKFENFMDKALFQLESVFYPFINSLISATVEVT